MTKKFFFTITLGIILTVANIDCYAQIDPNLLNIPKPAPIKEQIENLKSHLNRMTLRYKQMDINSTEGKSGIYFLLSHLEFPVITRGVTTRLRYMFDNSVIAHIEVEGVGETTPEDIEKGIFDVTLSPEQTTLYKTNIHVKSAKDSIVVLEGVANRRVIVVEGGEREFHKAVIKMWYARNGDRTIPEIKRIANFRRHLNSLAGDVLEGLWVYSPEKLSEQIGIIAGKNHVLPSVTDIKAELKKSTEWFDNLKWAPDVNLSTAVEHNVIARGDSTRIKFLFDNRRVWSIKVLGYGKASRDDLSKGEYVVTVAPKKTKLIECYVNRNERRHKRIIVIEPEKYEEVMRKFYSLQGSARRQYLNKLAGGVPEFAF